MSQDIYKMCQDQMSQDIYKMSQDQMSQTFVKIFPTSHLRPYFQDCCYCSTFLQLIFARNVWTDKNPSKFKIPEMNYQL